MTALLSHSFERYPVTEEGILEQYAIELFQWKRSGEFRFEAGFDPANDCKSTASRVRNFEVASLVSGNPDAMFLPGVAN